MRYFIVVFALFLVKEANSQVIAPTVVSTGGDFYENSVASLSYTIGEMTMVETFQNGTAVLTQGFQQPTYIDILVPEIDNFKLSIVVYPNPSDGNVNLLLNSDKNLTVNVLLYDNVGRAILSEEVKHNGGMNAYPLDWQMLSDGLYHLELVVTDSHQEIIYRLTNKINIIK